jgi:cyclopropane-fatty-acyl-phospholipid synthase
MMERSALVIPRDQALGITARVARALVHSKLRRLATGALVVSDRFGETAFGEPGGAAPSARAVVHDPRAYERILVGGGLGFGEALMEGEVEVDDLVALARVFLRNRDRALELEGGLARLRGAAERFGHTLRPNTRRGARRHVRAHYDLGNELFALFLDPTLSYSCGIYEDASATLEDASIAKLDRVCRKLGLGPEDHLLEIGTGWGGLATHAARTTGCRVTTTTLSVEQAELARARVRAQGLEDRVTVLGADFRDLEGEYSHAVSIEMIEAIGHENFGVYFGKIASLLAPGGAFLLQSITIRERHYAHARDSVDFIKRHVFPGCCIPSVSSLVDAARDASDFDLSHLEDIGPHYARTLADWRAAFLRRLPEVRALGYDERFIRMWDWYLAYCEAGFEERALGDVQALFVRPGHRGASTMPALVTDPRAENRRER